MAISKKVKPEVQSKPKVQVKEKPTGNTVKQTVKEEDTGKTPETIKNEPKKTGVPTKTELAMKIMEKLWDDIQAGKVKRKDVIQRFIDEVGLTKAGASTYYGNIKKKLSKVA